VIRALLLDAAGTLIEPAEPVAETYSRLLAAHGHHQPPERLRPRFAAAFAAAGEPDFARHPDGESAERAWWRGIVERSLGATVADAAFDALFDHYAAPAAWRVFDEVGEFLAAARDAGLRLAVVSNFDHRLHRVLAGHGLDFDAVLTSAEARRRKPDPAIFHLALARLGLAAAETAHAGDSRDADLDGAAAAGIRAYLVDRPERDLCDFLHWARDLPGK